MFRLFILLLPTLALAAQQKPREPFEDAVDRALVFLAKSQHKNGSWSPEPGNPKTPGDSALTALGVMAFLSAGHVPGEGKYAQTVERGIRFVMDSQQPNGLLALPDAGYVEMYSHGVCTLMLAEVAGMTEGKTADELKERLTKAVKVILKAQREGNRDAGGGGIR